jgi:pimeloyl-ACP methyl ester carboxylesterase
VYVTTRIGRWFYEEQGQASSLPPVVLMHGFLLDHSIFRPQVAELCKLTRVICFDNPGHGQSEVPRSDFTLEEHADALAGAVVTLGIKHAIVGGLSWGGMVGMRLALQQPAMAVGLYLLDTSAQVESRLQRAFDGAMLSLYARVGAPPRFYETRIAPSLFGATTRRQNPELVQRYGERMFGFSRKGVRRAGYAVVLRKRSLLSQLHRIHVPTLVICGEEDTATPMARSVAIAEGIRSSQLVRIPGAGHTATLEQPEPVTRAMVSFLRSFVPRA